MALLRNLELDGDPRSPSREETPTLQVPANDPSPRFKSPANEKLRSGKQRPKGAGSDPQPFPKANWENLLPPSRQQPTPQSLHLDVDGKASTDTSDEDEDEDGLAPSITGIPAHEPGTPMELYLQLSNYDSSGYLKWTHWALGGHVTSRFQRREGSPQLHDRKIIPTIDGPHGPFQRENGNPSEPNHMEYGLGPCIEQSEETAARKFYGVPCVFVPGEPYYTSPSNHTRPLSDAGKMARERWILECEESGHTSKALLDDTRGSQMRARYLGRPLLPAVAAQNQISEVPNLDAPQSIAIPTLLTIIIDSFRLF